MTDIDNQKPPVVLLLAAGMSQRMGDKNKLLLRHKNQAVIRHSAGFFRRHFSQVFIVTGFESDKLETACEGLDVKFIHNPDYEYGLGSSFVTGLMQLPNLDAPLLTALADQIFLTLEDIKAIKTAYHNQALRKVIIPQYQGRRGHPVLFPPWALSAMRAAKTPLTGRQFIDAYPQDCHFLVMPQPNCVVDIDTPADARQHLRPDETT